MNLEQMLIPDCCETLYPTVLVLHKHLPNGSRQVKKALSHFMTILNCSPYHRASKIQSKEKNRENYLIQSNSNTDHLGSVFECENKAHPLIWWTSLSLVFTTLTRSPSLPPTISTLHTSFTSPVPFYDDKRTTNQCKWLISSIYKENTMEIRYSQQLKTTFWFNLEWSESRKSTSLGTNGHSSYCVNVTFGWVLFLWISQIISGSWI